ncbi:hypothetical protein M3Y99_00668100 [Aphelenchoides fujianensis]|nr:hypothetical protein M3Y99_00668100 [Aphelenchoides fujianensis]
MRLLLFVVLLLAVATSSSTGTTEQPTIQKDPFANETARAHGEQRWPSDYVEVWTLYPQPPETTTRPTTHEITKETTRETTRVSTIDRPTPTTSSTAKPFPVAFLRPTVATSRPSTSTEDPIAWGLLRPTAAQTRRPASTVDPLAAGLLRPTRLPTRWGCWNEPSAAGAVRVDFFVLLLVLLYPCCAEHSAEGLIRDE